MSTPLPVTPTLWVPLPEAADPAVVGGKAARLGRLTRLGVAVPGGGVVTIAAHRLLRDGAMDRSTFDGWLRDRLRAAGYDAAARFAVRSSAAVEDSRRASFAGQFRSVLDVTRDEVPAAVAVVQRSVENPSVHAYAHRIGVPPPDTLAVLVQEQLRPRLSGVCFTADPVTGAAEAVVEYVEGLGDALLAGAELPVATIRWPYAGPRSAPSVPAGRHAAVVADAGRHAAVMADVVRLALGLAEHFGGPQDVEWAVDDRGLWALQTRPITTLAGPVGRGSQSGGGAR